MKITNKKREYIYIMLFKSYTIQLIQIIEKVISNYWFQTVSNNIMIY